MKVKELIEDLDEEMIRVDREIDATEDEISVLQNSLDELHDRKNQIYEQMKDIDEQSEEGLSDDAEISLDMLTPNQIEALRQEELAKLDKWKKSVL